MFLTFSFFFSASFAYGKGSVHFISLGRDCQVGLELIAANLRPAAFPLDWVASDFEGVIKAFEDDFEHFLDPLYLTYHPYQIYNSYYGFGYNHCFPIKDVEFIQHLDKGYAGIHRENFLDYLPSVQSTYKRRIRRLNNLLIRHEAIVFIRTHIVPSQAAHFVTMLSGKYPCLPFLLVVVHERADLIGDWHIDKVLNFYASKRSGYADFWERSEWNNILPQALNAALELK